MRKLNLWYNLVTGDFIEGVFETQEEVRHNKMMAYLEIIFHVCYQLRRQQHTFINLGLVVTI